MIEVWKAEAPDGLEVKELLPRVPRLGVETASFASAAAPTSAPVAASDADTVADAGAALEDAPPGAEVEVEVEVAADAVPALAGREGAVAEPEARHPPKRAQQLAARKPVQSGCRGAMRLQRAGWSTVATM